MVSDLEDLHVWAKALATGELLSTAMQKERLEWVKVPGAEVIDAKYGLGIYSMGEPGGPVLHGRGGNPVPGEDAVGQVNPDKSLYGQLCRRQDSSFARWSLSSCMWSDSINTRAPNTSRTLASAATSADPA